MKIIKLLVGIIICFFTGLVLIGVIGAFTESDWSTALKGSVFVSIVGFWGILLLKSAIKSDTKTNASKVTFEHAATLVPENRQEQDVGGIVYLDSVNSSLVFKTDQGGELLNFSFSQITKIKISLIYLLNDFTVAASGKRYLISFDTPGIYRLKVKYLWLYLIFGYFSITILKLFGARSEDIQAILAARTSTSEWLHYWLRSHKVPAYRQHLSPGEFVVLNLLLLLPVIVIVFGFLGLIFDK